MWLLDLDDRPTAVPPRPRSRRHCRPAHWYENSIAVALRKPILEQKPLTAAPPTVHHRVWWTAYRGSDEFAQLLGECLQMS